MRRREASSSDTAVPFRKIFPRSSAAAARPRDSSRPDAARNLSRRAPASSDSTVHESFRLSAYTDTPSVIVAVKPDVASPASVAISVLVPSEKTMSDALLVGFCPLAAYTPVR